MKKTITDDTAKRRAEVPGPLETSEFVQYESPTRIHTDPRVRVYSSMHSTALLSCHIRAERVTLRQTLHGLPAFCHPSTAGGTTSNCMFAAGGRQG